MLEKYMVLTQERENKMDKIKKYLMYFLIVIAFFILSDFLIYVGLNSSYRDIERQDSVEEVSIYQAEATKVNGRIRGLIQNPNGEGLNGKYVEVDLYSKRDVILGTKYVEINYLQSQETQEFRMGFRFTDVEYAKIELVDEVGENATPDSFVSDNLGGIALLTVVAFLIFFG